MSETGYKSQKLGEQGKLTSPQENLFKYSVLLSVTVSVPTVCNPILLAFLEYKPKTNNKVSGLPDVCVQPLATSK